MVFAAVHNNECKAVVLNFPRFVAPFPFNYYIIQLYYN